MSTAADAAIETRACRGPSVTLLDAGAAAHPALNATGADLVYDQRGEDGQRHVLIDGLWDDTVPATVSLVEDEAGGLLDNHHPAISADGRYVAYLEVPAAGTGCTVYFFDRDMELYQRIPCPAALAADPEAARPVFSAERAEVRWYLRGADAPITVPNALHAATTGRVE